MKHYGLNFTDGDRPPSELSVELACFRNFEKFSKRQNFKSPGRVHHFKRAVQILFCEGPNPPYIWTPWDDRRVEGFLNPKKFTTWWGPGASGKTTTAAAFAITYWLAAPDQTTVGVCSTTREMLEKRIWGEMLRLYQAVDELPGMLVPSKWKILLGDQNSKNGMFGIAILRGTMKEALGNLYGAHNRYVLLIVDEMQATREAAVEAKENMSAGADEFIFLGIGNPESRLDPLGKYSAPIDGQGRENWNLISTENDEWKTKNGICQFFNGLKSPAIAEPLKYRFLLNKKQIDQTRETKGADSPIFWSQRIGFIPPEGLLPTVMSESFIMQHHAMEKMEWLDTYETGAALDPAFSAEGDDAILTPFSWGNMKDGRTGILFWPQIVIPLKIGNAVSMTTMLMRDIRDTCTRLGVSPDRFALDCTGMQRMLADLLDDDWGKVHRVQFGGKASELPLSEKDPTKAKDRYRNRVAELWFSVSEFIRFDQVRGLSDEAAKEFCQRLVPDRQQIVLGMESKKDMKARTGRSPDYADSVAVAIDFIRVALGLLPGGRRFMQGSRIEQDLTGNELDNGGESFTIPPEQNVSEADAQYAGTE